MSEPLEGKQKRGRLRKRWIQAVIPDLEKILIMKWKQKAEDSKQWETILRNISIFVGCG